MPWRVYVGTPLGGYTSVIREDGALADKDRALAALRAVLMRYGNSVTITPWPMAEYAAGPFDGVTTQLETSVVDLADGAEAAIARMDGKFRRMAGQAERRGVQCAMCGEPDAVDRYYAILEDSATRWGLERPTFPKRLLEALVELGGDDVEIWLATLDGEAIAGGVILYGADEANFWSAAMRGEFAAARPSNALNVALIRAAAARNVRWYNLGSSEGLPGVQRFKEGVGAITLPYRTWRRDSSVYRLYRRLRGRRSRWV
jgi:hypothetical protein